MIAERQFAATVLVLFLCGVLAYTAWTIYLVYIGYTVSPATLFSYPVSTPYTVPRVALCPQDANIHIFPYDVVTPNNIVTAGCTNTLTLNGDSSTCVYYRIPYGDASVSTTSGSSSVNSSHANTVNSTNTTAPINSGPTASANISSTNSSSSSGSSSSSSSKTSHPTARCLLIDPRTNAAFSATGDAVRVFFYAFDASVDGTAAAFLNVYLLPDHLADDTPLYSTLTKIDTAVTAIQNATTVTFSSSSSSSSSVTSNLTASLVSILNVAGTYLYSLIKSNAYTGVTKIALDGDSIVGIQRENYVHIFAATQTNWTVAYTSYLPLANLISTSILSQSKSFDTSDVGPYFDSTENFTISRDSSRVFAGVLAVELATARTFTQTDTPSMDIITAVGAVAGIVSTIFGVIAFLNGEGEYDEYGVIHHHFYTETGLFACCCRRHIHHSKQRQQQLQQAGNEKYKEASAPESEEVIEMKTTRSSDSSNSSRSAAAVTATIGTQEAANSFIPNTQSQRCSSSSTSGDGGGSGGEGAELAILADRTSNANNIKGHDGSEQRERIEELEIMTRQLKSQLLQLQSAHRNLQQQLQQQHQQHEAAQQQRQAAIHPRDEETEFYSQSSYHNNVEKN